jgi:hypothetical protein
VYSFFIVRLCHYKKNRIKVSNLFQGAYIVGVLVAYTCSLDIYE